MYINQTLTNKDNVTTMKQTHSVCPLLVSSEAETSHPSPSTLTDSLPHISSIYLHSMWHIYTAHLVGLWFNSAFNMKHL